MLTDIHVHLVVNSLYMLWDWSALENVMFPRMGIRGQLLLGVMVVPMLAVLDVCVKLAFCSNLVAFVREWREVSECSTRAAELTQHTSITTASAGAHAVHCDRSHMAVCLNQFMGRCSLHRRSIKPAGA